MTEQPSTSQPLHGVRVVELATGVAGCYLGKLLADLGAEVVKVEPPGGDIVRRWGPFPGADPTVEVPEQGHSICTSTPTNAASLPTSTPRTTESWSPRLRPMLRS